MASDREYLKVTWIFGITAETEVANTSLNYSLQAGTSFDAVAALAEIVTATQGAALATRMGTLLASVNMKWADYSELNAVRFAAVGTDGRELAAAKVHDAGTTIQGNDSDVIPQATIVISLRSMQFGPGANFGRMYLPYTQWALDTNQPRGDSADVSAFATAADAFVEGCEADLNAVLTQVVDTMIISHISGRESRGVASIALGDITDTQRRRRAQLPELYTFRAIT